MSTPSEIDPKCPGCALLMKRLAEIEAVVARQGAEIERLKASKARTLRTSSKPPSSDAPWSKVARTKRKLSGKKRGAQPGHEGKTREPAPPGEVDDVKTVMPKECSSCKEPVTGNDPSPLIHQVIDIPAVDPWVVEYRLHQLECVKCGALTRAALPQGVHRNNFGPNLSALIVLLSGEYRMSRRNIQRFIADSFSIEVSLGAISNIEGRMTEGLAGAHAEALASVAVSPTKVTIHGGGTGLLGPKRGPERDSGRPKSVLGASRQQNRPIESALAGRLDPP